MDTLTMMQGGGPGGIVSSNAGYSGTPLWKLKQQGALPRMSFKEDEEKADAEAEEEQSGANLHVEVDAVSLGRSEDSDEKPLVRHIIVKDLRKVAARSMVKMPAGGLFGGKAPVFFFGLFDGQSCAEAPGPWAAELCAKSMIPKLLRNLSALPSGYENDTFIKATLKKTFEDLDKEILQGQPSIHDGCGASCALLVGDHLFTAVTGKCLAVLCETGKAAGQATYTANSLGENQGHCHLEAEKKFLTDSGGSVFQAAGGVSFVSSPSGAVSAVSRSLGDRAWKGEAGGVPGSLKLLKGTPETRALTLSWGEKHQCMVLTSAPVSSALTAQACVDIAAEFPMKPRAASGDIANKASDAALVGGAQCTVVVIYFRAPDDKAIQPPPSKKARKEAESVRLRHIVVKFRDCGQPFDPVRNKPSTRSREEAEAILRQALRELAQEAKTLKLPADASKAKLTASQPTPRYVQLCKDVSECTTAQKGGGFMGDLGWMSPEQLGRYGTQFAETAKALGIGQWSDLTTSEHGIHILQRIA
mmetsp:Transcript_34440/g.78531  ORF Transcript_34440/g.78531 Transcript_34440/m.78531 type:complete len:530 (-) Transcript_34440:46-1635(-)